MRDCGTTTLLRSRTNPFAVRNDDIRECISALKYGEAGNKGENNRAYDEEYPVGQSCVVIFYTVSVPFDPNTVPVSTLVYLEYMKFLVITGGKQHI